MEEARALSRTVAFEDGDPKEWLAIAQVESDTGRILEIAKCILVRDDFEAAIGALELLAQTAETEDDAAALSRELLIAIAEHSASLGAVALPAFLIVRRGLGDDTAWDLFDAMLRHPQWRIDLSRMVFAMTPLVVYFRKIDPERTLRMLESMDVRDTTNPVFVAWLVLLDGNTSDVPAEVMGVARDLASRMRTVDVPVRQTAS
jgi:hypothetical protein